MREEGRGNTFMLLEKDVLNLEMVGFEALVGGVLGVKTFLEKSEEDPGFLPGIRILEPLQQ